MIYSRICPASSVVDARKQLLGQGSRTIENISPNKAALRVKHVCTKPDMCCHKLLYHLLIYQVHNCGAGVQLIQAENLSRFRYHAINAVVARKAVRAAVNVGRRRHLETGKFKDIIKDIINFRNKTFSQHI